MAKNNHPRSTDGRGIFVQVRNGNVEQAIRKLKKKVTNEGIIQEVRDRQAFEPNHEKKKKAKAAAKSRWRKKQRLANQ
jgi:small subunit ribosomal protein S21